MTVSLRLQEIFPEPTPEQKGLIDASTLCMSRVEKTCIDVINEGWEAYRVDHAVDAEERRALSDRYITIVSDSRYEGIAVGVIGGAVAGGYAGGIYTAGNIGGVAVGAAVGGCSGYYAGSKFGLKIGRARAEATVTRMPEYRHWKTQKYQVILPALMRSMTLQEREPFNLECPITHDFMEEPVKAADDHYYEREIIRAWLDKWDRDYPPERLAQLTEEERRQIFLQTSPSHSSRIDSAHLYLHPDYYDVLYDRMKAIYNGKIGELHLSLQGHAPMRPEMAPMVRFYQRPLEEREELIDDVKSIVRRSHILQHEEKQQIRGLFDEAVEPPPVLL
jgi:hypothetical protein